MVKIDCLWAEDTPPLPSTLTCTHSSMRSPPLATLSVSHPSHSTPPPSHFCLPHLTLSPSSSFTPFLSLSVTPSSLARCLLQSQRCYLMQKVTWPLIGEKWLKAEPRWQPNSQGFFDYRYTTTRPVQLYLTALKARASLSFPPQFFTSSRLLVPSSLLP